VLLEVTDRCNLHCAVCFADSGRHEAEEPSVARISELLERAIAAAGPSNLQLSGGEPTLRDDLPEIVEAARRVGYSFIQVNTNGIRLAADKRYVQRLAGAGLASVFLQFDGVDDETYRRLRGRALLDEKLRAIENCGAAGLGVVLVPTVVKGVNSGALGAIVQRGVGLAPAVRGVHFQPVSYFGRFPQWNGDEARFTLPELMRALEAQTGGLVKVSDFSPPGCEHAHCSFHATYIRSADGKLKAIGGASEGACCSGPFESGGVRRTVETVSRRWSLPASTPFLNVGPSLDAPCCGGGKGADTIRIDGALDLDVFLQEAATRSFTISAMAFQDAANLDLERLRGCCISVVSPDGLLIRSVPIISRIRMGTASTAGKAFNRDGHHHPRRLDQRKDRHRPGGRGQRFYHGA
jgi:uncharacterized radical SAM superfamily Fe-S cluster-containing enzyme